MLLTKGLHVGYTTRPHAFCPSLSTYTCWSLSPDLTSLVIVFGSSLRNTAHHFHKFVHIDLSVSVFINLGDGLVDLLL